MENWQASSPRDVAYPPALKEKERAIWNQRGETKRSEPSVGFALSGGGIRSATFCLGVFQAFTKQPGLLRKIDYISSVSGGSFFASFYGRLFSREEIAGASEIEKIFSPNASDRLKFPDETRDGNLTRSWKIGIFSWLRENGRYLAPNGGGDVLTGVAVFLRNWITLQLLLTVSLLAIFLISQLLRLGIDQNPFAVNPWIWWSSYLYVAGVVALLVVLPLGWSYWSFSSREPDAVIANEGFSSSAKIKSAVFFGLRGVIVLLSLGLVLFAAGAILQSQPYSWTGWIRAVSFLVLEVTFAAWQYARLRGSLPETSKPNAEDGLQGSPVWSPRWFWVFFCAELLVSVLATASALEAKWLWFIVAINALAVICGVFSWMTTPNSVSGFINQSEKSRNLLTQYLRTWAAATFAIFAFALVDSAGQTLYAMSFRRNLLTWFIAGLSAISSAVPFAQSTLAFLRPKKTAHPKLSLTLLAGLGAAVLILPFVVSVDVLSHAIAYEFRQPALAVQETTEGCTSGQPWADLKSALFTLCFDDKTSTSEASPKARHLYHPSAQWSWKRVVCFSIVAGIFSLLAGGGWKGTAWVFVNRTSLHPLYAARLIRAYLGASNKLRYGSKVPGVSDPVDGDDIADDDYWRPRPESRFWQKGAPLHLVNVTINETIDGRSQTEERDRKGLGMAIGPAGFSVGVQHHVVIDPIAPILPNGFQSKQPFKVYPEAVKGNFRVFAPDEGGDPFAGKKLSLGNWTAISGAAVSTGLGSLNSLGTSLLAGFFNLRLGYWWDSGTKSITTGKGFSRFDR